MDPSAREFRNAAGQRLATAEFLQKGGRTLDAMYLAGYAIKCGLKSLALELTPEPRQHRMLRDFRTHNYERLIEILATLGCEVPLDLIRRFRRSGWKTDLRYQSGRLDTGEVRDFLKSVPMTLDWIPRELIRRSQE